jgi:DNA-binding NarL/FixJ family response regulator
MDKIITGIYDESNLVQQGICALVNDVEDIEMALMCNEKPQLDEKLRNITVHVLIFNMYEMSTSSLNHITQLSIKYPRMKILVFSILGTEDVVLRTIKAGAKGFLSKECGKNDLVEAVYTLRNGHDYFSKSITALLLNKYVTKIKTDDNDQAINLQNLSTRQIEILKLWGEGLSNQDIADRLFISIRTVETHKNHIMQKLNLKTTVDMVKYAIKNNLIKI